MELFIAIGIERILAEQLCATAGECFSTLPIEEPEDLHITLRYLGHTEQVNQIAERLQFVAHSEFSLVLGGYGSFVNESPQESVVWQGVSDPAGSLPALLSKIDAAIGDLAPMPVDRAFTPHITLAYLKEPAPQLQQLPSECAGSGITFKVSSIELSSVLPVKAPYRFRKIASYRLSSETKRKTARLLCVNDFHAALCENSGGLGAAKLTRAVNDYKAKYPETTVLFGGDNFFGDPMSELYRGAPVLDVMRAMDAVASVAGNHDFDFSLEQFREWQANSGVPMLAANLIERRTGKMPELVQPYRMLHSGDLRIAVIGLAMQEPMEQPDRPREWNAYALTDGIASARKWVDFLNAGGDQAGVPDAIFALTHFGLRETMDGQIIGDEIQRLAREVPELAGAFAAHFHRFVQFSIGHVAVAESGGTGKGFAAVAMTFDRTNKLLSSIPLCYNWMAEKDRLAEDEAIAQRMWHYYAQAEHEMGRTIAVAARPLPHKDPMTNTIPMTGTPLTQLATDVMKKASNCPIALLYAGRITGGFEQGPISLYQYYQVFGFANVIVTARLTGRQIWANIQTGMRKLPEDGASPLAVGGLIVTIDPDRAIGERVLNIRLADGKPLDLDAEYPVVLEDYLASDPLGFRFSDGKDLQYHEMTLRRLMLEHLERQGSLAGTYPDNILIQRSGK